MSKKLKSYLRTCRMRSGLSQRDMAFLLDFETTSTVSRMEKSHRDPSVHILLTYCVIFNVSPAELVPGLLHDIEKTVVNRAKVLQKELESNEISSATLERIEFLKNLISGE